MSYSMQPIEIQRFNWGEIEWIHEPKMSPNYRLSLAKVTIYPQSNQKKHFHVGEEQLLYVIEGQGIFIENGKENYIQSPMFQYIAPYAEHEVINEDCNQNLVMMAVYVPIKLSPMSVPKLESLVGRMSHYIKPELILSMTVELSDLLKLKVSYLEVETNKINETNETNETKEKNQSSVFCEVCKKHMTCSLDWSHDVLKEGGNFRLKRCQFGIAEIEKPLLETEAYCGSFITERFILDENISDLCYFDIFREDEEIAKCTFSKMKRMIKSRIYVIFEHLTIAAQFFEMIMERRFLESALLDKENEIIKKTQEQLKLKSQLMMSNYRNATECFFQDELDHPIKMIYPYAIEKTLEDALILNDKEQLIKCLSQLKYLENCNLQIMQELMIVLSRIPAKLTGNYEKTAILMNRYKNLFDNQFKEQAVETFRAFCLDCMALAQREEDIGKGELIERVNQFIKSHYREPITLQLVATHFYISPNYLSTKFNEINKCSFTRYVMNLRIDAAEHLLMQSHMKIIDIARKVGFKDESYFSRCFKLRYKATPRAYRDDKKQ